MAIKTLYVTEADKKLFAKASALARQDRRSLSSIVASLLADWIESAAIRQADRQAVRELLARRDQLHHPKDPAQKVRTR